MNRLIVVVVMLASAAFADVPPADSTGCREKKVSDACKRDDGSDGSCLASTCSRNDYSGGIPPKSVQFECLKCGAAPAPAPAPAEKKNSCATIPGESLAALAIVLGALRRTRRT